MGIRDDVWNLMVPGGSWELGLHSVSVLAGRKAEGGSLSYSQAQLSPVWSLVTSVRTAGPWLGKSSPFGFLTGVI